MSRAPALPRRPADLVAHGFAVRRHGLRTLIASPDDMTELEELGFHEPVAWESSIAASLVPGGRGGSGLLRLGDGTMLRLKRLCRGGWARPILGDRFADQGRLLANLTLPQLASARGVVTPRAEVLLVAASLPGLRRGWLATVDLPGAIDLANAARRNGPPGAREWRAVMEFVRSMHDRGLEHRDLNAGNLLWKADGGLAVVDLDGARLHEGPVPFELRQRGLRRLDRSWVKLFGAAGHAERLSSWHDFYAGGDELLASRLADGEPAGRRISRLHRAGR